MSAQLFRMRQIEVLHAVITSNSISAAARTLQISQPVVSRTIRRLEDKLGVALFERHRGRLIPTTEALRIHAEIDQIISRIGSLDRRIAGIVSGEDQLFRIGAAPSICRCLAPMALGRIARSAPNLTVFLDTLFSAEMLQYLIGGPGECVVTTISIDHPAIASQQIGSGALIAAVPKGHPLASRTELAAKDFAGVSMIGYIDQQGPHSRAAGTYLHTIEPRIRIYARFAEAALALVNEEAGVLLTDPFSAAGPLGDNVVLRRLIKPPAFPLYLHWNPDRPRSRYIAEISQAFADALDEIMRRLRS
jgi:DNA-binding transcriptional LysR family regulator